MKIKYFKYCLRSWILNSHNVQNEDYRIAKQAVAYKLFGCVGAETVKMVKQEM